MIGNKKIYAALATAALLAVGTSMTVYAASGWQEENGDWVYLDKDGDYVTDTWKKSGSQFYYLDESGKMAVNTLVEYNGYLYYVGEDGVQVRNEWVCIANDDAWDEEVDNIWYYFGAAGRAYTDGKKTIGEKKYIFDDEGHMLSGWQQYGDNEDWYYMGGENEGWALAGWQHLEPDEDMDGDYDGEEWFFFKISSGTAYRDDRKHINGSYYTFDENGVMQDKWSIGTPAAPDYSGVGGTSESNAYYYDGDGSQGKGWVYTYAPDDVNENDDKEWYYLDKNGVPFNENGKDSGEKSLFNGGSAICKKGEWADYENPFIDVAAKVIKDETYLFDNDGRMLTGLYYLTEVACAGSSKDLGSVRITAEEGVTYYQGGFYYFCEEEGPKEGRMMTGKQTIEYEGDYYYYFKKDGMAYSNIIADGALYAPDGAKLLADDDYRKVEVNLNTVIYEKGNNKKHFNCIMFVNRKGRVIKSGAVKYDGIKYTIKDYEVIGEEEID